MRLWRNYFCEGEFFECGELSLSSPLSFEKCNWKRSSVEHKLSVKSIHALQKIDYLANDNADKNSGVAL